MTPAPRHPDRAAPPAVQEEKNSLVLHFLTLRKAIGFIGIALPVVLVLGENLRDWLAPQARAAGRVLIELSISAYFHTGMRDVFVGSLCAIGVFLLCYRGYDRTDNLLAKGAGVCALVVALCPTPEASREATEGGVRPPDSVTFFSGPNAPDPTYVGYIHFGAALAFFVLLAVMSLTRFTLTDPGSPPTRRKEARNRVYRACGIVILLSLVGIAAAKLLLDAQAERTSSFVFWFETIAVMAFGVSWLTKGEAILEDH